MTTDATPAAAHPLDALTTDDIRAATAAWQADPRIPDGALVHVCCRYEPDKDELLAHRSGDAVDRRVRYLLRDKVSGTGYDVVASATSGTVVSVREIPGAHPPYSAGEFYFAGELARADPRFVAGCERRGVTDMSTVQLDPWPAGRFGEPWEVAADGRVRRICRIIGYHRHDAQDNGYAHPLDGLVATVDIDTNEVVDIVDDDPQPFPSLCSRYDPEHERTPRGTSKPIEITQPQGTSFSLQGNHIQWEGWSLRFSMHPVTGMVLHNVTYLGRSLAHRLSLAEMVVPYAGLGPNTRWKNTFDAGELSMGKFVNSLSLGCDCLGDITYCDVAFSDDWGNPYEVANAICLHEEDHGVAWKHTDLHSGVVALRRARRFVLNSVITAGNYEYGFRWYLHNDGRLQLEIQASGIIQTERLNADGSLPHATRMVMPGLAGAHHQHIFCARLDLDVDGRDNCVIESEVVPTPELGGHSWELSETLLRSESEGVRDASAATMRRWRVINRGVTNAVGDPVAYEVVPQASVPLIATADSSVAKRAAFGRHAMWVTAYDPDQLHAASDCANLDEGLAGLPTWIKADRPLVDTDVVLWHTFGITHVVRPEDWPVMPVEVVGFTLRPLGFFDENPAMDVDPPVHACHT